MSQQAESRRPNRVLLALIGITLIALFARFLFLGDRISHWDEGRVGYDILRYMATGTWEYRPIVHGPFIPQVNRLVFETFGATDFTSRVAIALIGGLFPLSAWLYRDHLTDPEMILVAVFFAADPLLVYYSRFMRNDILVAAFVFTAVGFYLRLIKTRRARYLYAGTAAFALAFTAKENALIYVITLLGSVALLFDHRLFLARYWIIFKDEFSAWQSVARTYILGTLHGLWQLRLPFLLAVIEFIVIITVFFAPRAGTAGGIGLDAALTQPHMIPAVIELATIGAADKLVSQWITGGLTDHSYLPFLGYYLKILGSASGPLALLAAFGFLADRYGDNRPRDIVALGFYWGFVSILGYPIIVDIRSAWSVIHAVVPLAIPAAAGAALIYQWGRDSLSDDDRISASLAAVVILLVGFQMGATTVSTSYLNPQSEENVLVQYAQPAGEMRDTLNTIDRVAAEHEGLDVLWYGEFFHVEKESALHRPPVSDGEWYNRLPLPWYLEAANATMGSVETPTDLETQMEAERPAVVIARSTEKQNISEYMTGYESYEYELRQFGTETVFYIDEAYTE